MATSRGEADSCALARSAAEARGLAATMADLDWTCEFRLKVDSSAAKSVASR